MVDENKLNAFVGKVLQDLGGATSIPLVRMGERFGLYKALAQAPLDSAGLAAACGIAERYAREWLAHQAASGYVAYDAASGRFSLEPEQAMVFADENSPLFMVPGFDLAAAGVGNEALVAEAFRHGGGVQWGELGGCVFCAVGRFYRAGYAAHLVAEWLPALDGMVARLERGAKVADLGCGHGFSTALMAEAFPNSTFIGYDFHPGSIEQARAHAAHHAVGNLHFEVATAKNFPGHDYDLVTCFDCLHDMGDPAGAAAHVHQALKTDGTWMVVEPAAGDGLHDNLNPVSRLYYAGSVMICVPTSLAQEVGAGLGAQAGEARLAEVIRAGGFSAVRKATATPFNMVLEARA